MSDTPDEPSFESLEQYLQNAAAEGQTGEQRVQTDAVFGELIALAGKLSLPLPGWLPELQRDDGSYDSWLFKQYAHDLEPSSEEEEAFVYYLEGLVEQRMFGQTVDPEMVFAPADLPVLLGVAQDDDRARAYIRLTNQYLAEYIEPLDEEELLQDRVLKGVIQEAIMERNAEDEIFRQHLQEELEDVIRMLYGERDYTAEIASGVIALADHIAARTRVADAELPEAEREARLEDEMSIIYGACHLPRFEEYLSLADLLTLARGASQRMMDAAAEEGYLPRLYPGLD